MAGHLISDGKAVDVLLTEVVEKGNPVYCDGFFGIAMQSGSSGDTIALEIAQREHQIVVESAVTAVKGDILYIDADGAVSEAYAAGSLAFMKVTRDKDSNDIVWGILLPQVSGLVLEA